MSMRWRCTARIVPLLIVGACAPEEERPVAAEVLGAGANMAILNMDTYVTREGVRRARLTADTAEFMEEGEVHLRPFEMIFYDVDGAELSIVTAEYGVYHENEQDMDAEGSVVVIDQREDRRLETERLRYVQSEDRLYGAVPFTLWEDGGATVIRGSAFESDPALDSVRIVSPSGQAERIRAGPPGRAGDSRAGAGRDSIPAASDSLRRTGPDSIPGPEPASVPDSANAPTLVPDSANAPASDTAAATRSDTATTAPPDSSVVGSGVRRGARAGTGS